MADTGAYDGLVEIFRQYGLESLAQDVLRLAQEGYSGSALALQLQQTESYKQRFAGNEERRRKGLQVLNPAEYLSVEAAYRQAFQSYGLDARFGGQEYLSGLIGRDVAPTELVKRIQLAGQAAQTADPQLKQMLSSYYGVGPDQLVEYFLDEKVGSEILQKQAVAAEIGAAAANQRLDLQRTEAERLADAGVTKQQALAALGGTNADAERAIASRFGTQLGDGEIVGSQLGLDSGATAKRDRLAQQERALFRGSGGVAAGRDRSSY